eukprot:PhM_4_TR14104/c1_g1_i1/m.95382
MTQPHSLELSTVLGYSGTHICCLGGGEVCYAVASGLVFYNYRTGAKSYYGTDTTRPITCVRYNQKHNMIVFSERKLNPTIMFLSLPDKQIVHQLNPTMPATTTTAGDDKDEAQNTEFVDFAFSRDGSSFATLSGLPHYTLSLYTVTARTNFTFLCSNSELKHQVCFVSFNPRNALELCTSGAGHITFWRTDTLQSTTMLVPTEGYITTENVRLYSHAWMITGDVIAGSYQGEIFKFDVASGRGELQSEVSSMELCVGIVATLKHYLIAFLDGTVRMVSHDLMTIEKTFQVSSRAISTFHIAPEYHTLILGGSDGTIFSIFLSGYERPTLSDDELRSMSGRIHALGDFGGRAFIGICPLSGDACVVVDEDGVMRVWGYNNNTLLSKSHVGASPTCMDLGAGPTANTLVIGHETGTLRMYNLSTPNKPEQLFREKLGTRGINLVRVHGAGRMLVVSMGTNYLYFVDIQARAVLGWVRVGEDSAIYDVTWLPSLISAQCLVSQKNGDVHLLIAPLEASEDETYALEPEDVIQNVWKLDYPARRIHCIAAFDDTLHLMSLSVDKETKMYVVDLKVHSDYKEPKFKEIRPSVQFTDHDKVGTCITLGESKARTTLMLTAGSDGRLCLRDATAFQQQNRGNFRDTSVARFRRHSPYGKGIVQACFARNDTGVVLSAGADGAIMVWRAPGQDRRESVPFSISPQEDHINEEEEEEYDFIKKREVHAHNLEMLRHESHRAMMRERIGAIAQRMQKLREENEKVPEIEQLDIHEFVVQRQREEIHELGNRQIEEVREQIMWDNLKKDWLVHMMKKECWESMLTKQIVMKGLSNGDIEVPNFVIPKRSKRDLTILKKIKFLRRVEMAERKMRNEKDPLVRLYEPKPGEEEAEDEDEDVDDMSPRETPDIGVSEDSAPPPPPEEEEEEGAEKKKVKTLEEECDEPVDDLLYPEFRCFTRQRIVIQNMLLLTQVSLEKRTFNSMLNETMKKKKNEIDKILERNVRIRQIMKELDEKHTLFTPSMADSEKPEIVLEVTDAEIGLDKSLDPESRKNKESEAELERRRKAANDDSSVRALNIWMDGKLEKDEKLLQITVEMPEWADEHSEKYIEPSEWDEEQQRAFKDYEKRLAKQKEEIETRRKQFQQELASLQREIQDIAKTFDVGLKELLKTRHAISQKLHELELKAVKLFYLVVLQEERVTNVVKLETTRDVMHKRAEIATKQAEAFKEELEDKLTVYNETQAEEKHKERTIKSQPPFSDAPDHADMLVKIYLKAKAKKKTERAGKKDARDEKKKRPGEDMTMDPFAFVEREDEQRKRDVKGGGDGGGDHVRLERPEVIPQEIWSAFLEFRQQRVDAERSIRTLQEETTDMQNEFQALTTQEEDVRRKYTECVEKIDRFNEQTTSGWYNADVLLRVRQGQVEVEQQAVATDYKDAIYIHKDRITDLNAQIRESGEGKVAILEDMKEFKRGIRFVEWQNEVLAFTASTLDMEHRHLHTLRVTKQMQEFVKGGGGEGHNESERAKLLRKLDHTAMTMQAKIEEKRAQTVRYRRMIKEKEAENVVLDGHVGDVQQLVTDRKNIVDLQTTSLDQERNDRRMKLLRATRRLEDVAKAQQEEMTALKKEIDRLRERTFPSFAVVSKRVVGNPDEAPK